MLRAVNQQVLTSDVSMMFAQHPRLIFVMNINCDNLFSKVKTYSLCDWYNCWTASFFSQESWVSRSRCLSFAVYAIYIIRSSSPHMFICMWIHKEWNTHHTAVIANQNGHKLPAGRCLLYDRRQLLNCGCMWPAISEYTQGYIVAWIQPSGHTTQQRHYDAKRTFWRHNDVIIAPCARWVK